MVDVLIENVFAHTPAGVGYEIEICTRSDGVQTLTITDDGPGFADDTLTQRGHSGAGGTGLGLDIVGRTAARTGGGIRVRTSPRGGAEIEVVFGVSATSEQATADS